MPQPPPDSPPASPRIEAATSRTELPPEGGRIQVLLTIEPGSRARVTGRHIVLCLDESRSMEESLGSGERPKMAHVTAAAREAIEGLSGEDHVGVVAFENTPEVVAELAPLAQAGYDTVVQAIEELGPGGGTDILSALKLAREQHEQFETDPTQARRILLLSDGSDRFEPSTFAELAAELGEMGVSIMTGGIGPEYDEEVMLALADRSHGYAAHLESPEDIETFVYRAVVETERLVAANPTLSFDISPVFEFHNVFCRTPETKSSEMKRTHDGGTVRTTIPDLLVGQTQTVVFEVLAPPRQAGTTHDIGDIALRAGGQRVSETGLSVEYTSDPGPENTDVAVKYEETRIAGELRSGANPEEVGDDIDAIESKADEEIITALRRKRTAVKENEDGSRVRAGLPPAREE